MTSRERDACQYGRVVVTSHCSLFEGTLPPANQFGEAQFSLYKQNCSGIGARRLSSKLNCYGFYIYLYRVENLPLLCYLMLFRIHLPLSILRKQRWDTNPLHLRRHRVPRIPLAESEPTISFPITNMTPGGWSGFFKGLLDTLSSKDD